MVVWKDFRQPYIPENILKKYIQHMMFEHFTRRSQFSVGNQSREIHGSVTTHTNGSVPFISHVKQMVKLILITSIF
jgi:hypothetical protein